MFSCLLNMVTDVTMIDLLLSLESILPFLDAAFLCGTKIAHDHTIWVYREFSLRTVVLCSVIFQG